MRGLNTLVTIFLSVAIYVGCSEVGFDTVKGLACEDFNEGAIGTCSVGEDGFNNFDLSFRTGQVDIVFVVDNSGSMVDEQLNMADRLGDILGSLSLSDVDYKIGVITTDVQSAGNNVARAANGNGTFWNGTLLKFPDGTSVLTRDESNALDYLQETIKRDESIACRDNGFKAEFCPSNDERGIFALNLLIEKNPGFFRSGARAHFVFLADEDERSQGFTNGSYPIESKDKPETLISNVKLKLGVTKVFRNHSVIIRPGDNSCLDENTYTVSANGVARRIIGQYGDFYAALSSPSEALLALGNIQVGTTGSICEKNWGPQIGDITSDLTGETTIQLPCPAEGLTVNSDSISEDDLDYSISQTNVITINAPPGHEINLRFRCLNTF